MARIIDLIYGTILGFALGIVVGIVFTVLTHMGKLTPEWPQLMQEDSSGGFILGVVGAFLYHAVSEGFGTVTVGKLVCGLRVVHTDGRPATMKGGLIRDLAYHLDALFFGLIGYQSMKKGPLQQRYGDVWAQTIVVKKGVFQPHPTRGPGRMFVGILMGSSVWGGMLVLEMISKVT